MKRKFPSAVSNLKLRRFHWSRFTVENGRLRTRRRSKFRERALDRKFAMQLREMIAREG